MKRSAQDTKVNFQFKKVSIFSLSPVVCNFCHFAAQTGRQASAAGGCCFVIFFLFLFFFPAGQSATGVLPCSSLASCLLCRLPVFHPSPTLLLFYNDRNLEHPALSSFFKRLWRCIQQRTKHVIGLHLTSHYKTASMRNIFTYTEQTVSACTAMLRLLAKFSSRFLCPGCLLQSHTLLLRLPQRLWAHRGTPLPWPGSGPPSWSSTPKRGPWQAL